MTQAGIAEGTGILRSHIPRALQALSAEGLVVAEETHVRGRSRKTHVYRLTEAGVRRARELLDSVDATPVLIDGRSATIGEVRRSLALTPIAALSAVDVEGHIRPTVPAPSEPTLLQRGDGLSFLRRWIAGPAYVAVVYGSRGMGKTSLARAFARVVPKVAWIDLEGCDDAAALAAAVARASGVRVAEPCGSAEVAAAILAVFARGWKLIVIDGYGDVPEEIVEVLTRIVRDIRDNDPAKILVLAQESTPAYCRFYDRSDLKKALVAENHLRGLDLEGCRSMLANPDIDEEALRRIYLLTKGCPLYLRYIREGDAESLRAHSRFTNAEVRLLLYSGGAVGAAAPLS